MPPGASRAAWSTPALCERCARASGRARLTCRPGPSDVFAPELVVSSGVCCTIPSMSHDASARLLARRSFFSRLGFGLAGGAVGAAGTPAQAQTAGGRFDAARHAMDDWLDQIPGTHRYLMDAPYPE